MPNRRPSVGPSVSSSSSLPIRRVPVIVRPLERLAQRALGVAVLDEPRVGRVDLRDRATDDAVGQPPVRLDLDKLGE